MADQAKQHQTRWQKIKQHWVTIGVVAIVLVIVIMLIIAGYWFDWTGFNGYNKVTIAHIISGTNAGTVTKTEEYQPGKALWDWLSLLGVLAIPAVVGLGATWYRDYAIEVLSHLDMSETWHQERMVFWQTTYFNLKPDFKNEVIMPIISKIGIFSDNMQLRRIVGQSITRAPVHLAITEGKIVLCALSARDMDDSAVNILGSTLINLLHRSFGGQQSVPLKERRKVFVAIQEKVTIKHIISQPGLHCYACKARAARKTKQEEVDANQLSADLQAAQVITGTKQSTGPTSVVQSPDRESISEGKGGGTATHKPSAKPTRNHRRSRHMGKRPVGVPPPVPTTTQTNQPTNDVANGRNGPLPGAGGRSASGGTSWGTSMGREGREGRERG